MVKLSRPTTSLLLKTLWTLFTGDVENIANDPTNLESNVVVLGAQISFVFPRRTSFRCLHNEGYLPDLVFIDASLVTTLNAKNRQNFSAPSPSLTAIAQVDLWSSVAVLPTWQSIRRHLRSKCSTLSSTSKEGSSLLELDPKLASLKAHYPYYGSLDGK
jgi:hypothetical protein